MKRMIPLAILMMAIIMISGCSGASGTGGSKEEKNVKAEGVKNTSQKSETQLTEIPVNVGAHPRCCVGIDVKKAELQTNPDLLVMKLELRTLLGAEEGVEGTDLYVGYKDMIPAFNLLTDKGVYDGYLHNTDILKDGQPKTYEVVFPDAKGKPLGLSIRRLFEESQIKDGSYREADKQGSFAYLEDVNDEMMKRIGRQMFDKVTAIELSKTEDEATEKLDSIFDRDNPPEIYGRILDEISYDQYSKYEINYKNEHVEFKDKGALIGYDADVEITLFGKDGNVDRTKGFGISSLIGISTDTGDYYYGGLNYDYLTGTDDD